MITPRSTSSGFTLIELSIVLVIIGLIVGGILVGQTLISASAARAQISQIEKFNTAANTFYGKYGYLPGDILATQASTFGLVARTGTQGRGDGNGLVEGWCYSCGGCTNQSCEPYQLGENAFFWEDLSSVNLIEGSFNSVVDAQPSSAITLTSSPSIPNWLPQAKIGNGNFVSVEAFYIQLGNITAPIDYFVVTAVTNITTLGTVASQPGITVAQAYSIDTKLDDGFPLTGRVQARYSTSSGSPETYSYDPTAGSPTTCYDNGDQEARQKYSITQNGGAGVNCGLSFQFQ